MELSETIQRLSIAAIPILFAITLHEAAHGFVANRKGDPTARMLGRLTLNPLAHVDLFGTIIIPLLTYLTAGFVFGYAKPVPVNAANFRNPKEDMAWVAAAGPGINLAQAFGAGLMLKLLLFLFPALPAALFLGDPFSGRNTGAMWLLVPFGLMLLEAVKWNVLLAVFNLIPIPPLDGGRVAVGLLPPGPAAAWASIEPFGFFIVLALVLFNPLGIMSNVIFPLILALERLILG